MAIPVVEGFTATQDTDSVSSLVVTKTSGVVAGDLLLMIAGNERADVITDTWNTPTGWTKIVGAIPTQTSVDCCGMSWWREASGDSGDDAPTITWEFGARVVAWYIRVSGADVSDPINIAGVDAQASAGTVDSPSVTTDAGNCLAFSYSAFDGDDFPMTLTGTGWTESDEQTVSTLLLCNWGTKEQASAGATGIATHTAATLDDGIVAVQFAINEDAGGSPVVITDVNTTETWDDGDTGLVIIGTGFV